jgi:hypothetical protein
MKALRRRGASRGHGMARMRKKGDLPTKVCAACGRPFAWRKKWERVWDEVRYCSDRCRADAKRTGARNANGEA